MKLVHQRVDAGRPSASPIRILLIGAGGNGSNILFGLAYLHFALLAWGFPEGLQVAVIDGDTVSPTNCVRQPFGAADIGHHKATVLVNRVNLFHQLDWTAIATCFTSELPLPDSWQRLDMVISCVDSRAARCEMHKTFQSTQGPWSRVPYWLDLGNAATHGQFVLGQPLNQWNKRSRTRLRTVTELFPSIMDTSLGEGDLPSCSAAEALTRQEPFVNNVLAANALAMLTRLYRYGEIDYHGAFCNTVSGRTVPLPIDPDAWEKCVGQRRRRARALAHAA